MKRKNQYKKIWVFIMLLVSVTALSTVNVFAIAHKHSNANPRTNASFGFIALVFWIVFIVVKMLKIKKNGESFSFCRKPKNKSKNTELAKDFTTKIMEAIYPVDHRFNSTLFLTMAENDLYRIFSSMGTNDITQIDSFTQNNARDKLTQIVNQQTVQNKTTHFDDMNISKSYLTLYKRDMHFEYLTAYLSLTVRESVSMPNKKGIMQTKNNGIVDKRLIMTYTRSKGGTQDENIPTYCPHCGANITGNETICPFCHSTVIKNTFDWILTNWNELVPNSVPLDERGVLIEDDSNVNFTRESSGYFTGYYDNGMTDNYKDPFKNDLGEAFADLYHEMGELESQKEKDKY